MIRERGTDDRRRVTVHAVPEKLREVERLYEGQGASMAKLLAKYSPEEFSVIADLKHTGQVLAGEAKKLQGGRGNSLATFCVDPLGISAVGYDRYKLASLDAETMRHNVPSSLS